MALERSKGVFEWYLNGVLNDILNCNFDFFYTVQWYWMVFWITVESTTGSCWNIIDTEWYAIQWLSVVYHWLFFVRGVTTGPPTLAMVAYLKSYHWLKTGMLYYRLSLFANFASTRNYSVEFVLVSRPLLRARVATPSGLCNTTRRAERGRNLATPMVYRGGLHRVVDKHTWTNNYGCFTRWQTTVSYPQTVTSLLRKYTYNI